MEKILFYVFSTIALASASAVIFSRNSVRAVLLLVLTFFSSAGLWLLLKAEFLAITLVLVYVGAVMVLFLFVVMMLDINISAKQESLIKYFPVGLLIAALIIGQIIWIVSKNAPAAASGGVQSPSNIKAIGLLLYTEYLYPFEIAGVILLVAIIAAITLTFRGRRPNTKGQKIAEQIAVRKEDRVQLVKMNDNAN